MSLTVLVVEDEKLIRDLVGDFLREKNYEVVEASDGAEAILILESKKIDIIITDIKMPRMTGIQLLNEIRIRNFSFSKIIVMSGNWSHSKDEMCSLGATDFIDKPFHLDSLVQILSSVRLIA